MSGLLGGEFYYVDDDAHIQGPFDAVRMGKWFRKGYLRSQLLLRCRRDADGREESLTPLLAEGGLVLSEGAAVAVAERQARERERAAETIGESALAVVPGEWVTMRYAVTAVHGRGGEYACPFVSKKEAATKMEGRRPKKEEGRGASVAGRAHDRTPTEDLARRLLTRSISADTDESTPSSVQSGTVSVIMPDGSRGGSSNNELNNANLDLESIREKISEEITRDADMQLRSHILQEQLQIALCKLELESLHAVRQSLSEDNSAITQLSTLEEDVKADESAGARKEERVRGLGWSTDHTMSTLTEVLDGRLQSFQGMCAEVSQLEARALQIKATMNMEDEKRVSRIE